MAGVAENARAKLHRSSRTGTGSGTPPFRKPTTIVSPSEGSRPLWEKPATAPARVASEHGSRDPPPPPKQATSVISAGAVTRTVARSMGTDHSVPMAFQYSSSCSENPFRAASIRYTIV